MENLQTLRKIYQHPVFEAGLLIAILIHMVSNTVIIMNRGKSAGHTKKDGNGQKPAGTTELQLHRYVGYFLSVSIVGHVGATRLAPMFILEDPSDYDYSFVAKVAEIIPIFFAGYLGVLGICGGYHLIYGTRSALATLSGSSVIGKPFPGALKVVGVLNLLFVTSAVMALSGFYYVVDTSSKAELHDQINEKLGI